jgi:hypothetical protein
MKEKILAFLKTKLTGVPETYLLGVAEHYSKTITEETQIATTLTDGVVDLLKLNAGLLQTEGDKRATEASKTALKTFREKHGLGEDGKPIKADPKPVDVTDPNEPAWFTAYKKEQAEATRVLNEKLENQEKEKTSVQLTARVKAHEKLKDIPEEFLTGRNLVPKSEAEIDQLATEIRTSYDGFIQKQVEKGVFISKPPEGGGGPGDKSTVDAYLDEKFPKAEKK